MKIRYDQENDTIEIILKDIEGDLRKTTSPYIMQKVDSKNNIIAFSILKVSTLKQQGSIELINVPEAAWTDFKLWYEMKS
jgi:hypothetical protein